MATALHLIEGQPDAHVIEFTGNPPVTECRGVLARMATRVCSTLTRLFTRTSEESERLPIENWFCPCH
jgi:hypothetical protein